MTMPALSPIQAPDLVCTECGTVMRRVIKVRNANGKLDSVAYFCDGEKCKYGMRISGQHANAQNTPYEPPARLSDPVSEKDPFAFRR